MLAYFVHVRIKCTRNAKAQIEVPHSQPHPPRDAGLAAFQRWYEQDIDRRAAELAASLRAYIRRTVIDRRKVAMKYVISWFDRPQGSPMEYENAQKRILDVFGQWKAPANFKIDFFVIRVGEWGGHMLVDCDDPVTVHKFCSMLPAFVFEARPVIAVEEAVRGELEVMAWRDGLKGK